MTSERNIHATHIRRRDSVLNPGLPPTRTRQPRFWRILSWIKHYISFYISYARPIYWSIIIPCNNPCPRWYCGRFLWYCRNTNHLIITGALELYHYIMMIISIYLSWHILSCLRRVLECYTPHACGMSGYVRGLFFCIGEHHYIYFSGSCADRRMSEGRIVSSKSYAIEYIYTVFVPSRSVICRTLLELYHYWVHDTQVRCISHLQHIHTYEPVRICFLSSGLLLYLLYTNMLLVFLTWRNSASIYVWYSLLDGGCRPPGQLPSSACCVAPCVTQQDGEGQEGKRIRHARLHHPLEQAVVWRDLQEARSAGCEGGQEIRAANDEDQVTLCFVAISGAGLHWLPCWHACWEMPGSYS